MAQPYTKRVTQSAALQTPASFAACLTDINQDTVQAPAMLESTLSVFNQ